MDQKLRKLEAEQRSGEFYLKWKLYQCCPRCDGDRLHIRLMAPTASTRQRWKFNCKECGTYWYGPDWVK